MPYFFKCFSAQRRMTYLLDVAAAAASGKPHLGGSGGRPGDSASGERRRGLVQLVRRHMRVPADGGEVGVAKIGGDETRVARLLTQPRRGGVTERVGGDPLLDRGSVG